MRLILPLLLSVSATIGSSHGSPADGLSAVLARMDKNAESFQAMTAVLTQVNHTEIIDENETLNATVQMKRTKAGIVGRVDFTGTNSKILSIRDRQLQVYYPKSNIVELYDVGKFGDQLDQFLLLGFSTSGKQLERDYHVKLIGTETVSGQVTTRLELTPKSKEALEMFKKTDLWLAQDATHPVKEIIHKNDKDFTFITYSEVHLIPALADKALELVLPPGVKKVTPQK